MDDHELLQAGFRYALSLSADPAEAEDLAQQGWLRLYGQYGKVHGRSILFTTIRRLFIDRYRRRGIVELVAIDDLHEEPRHPAVPNFDRVDLERLLSSLRPKEREVLYLHVVEGYTAAEISRLTGTGRGTVLSLIHRARRKMAAEAAQGRRMERSG